LLSELSGDDGTCVSKGTPLYKCYDIKRFGQCSTGAQIKKLENKCVWLESEIRDFGRCLKKVQVLPPFFYYYYFIFCCFYWNTEDDIKTCDVISNSNLCDSSKLIDVNLSCFWVNSVKPRCERAKKSCEEINNRDVCRAKDVVQGKGTNTKTHDCFWIEENIVLRKPGKCVTEV
jgi:hypothetical protein